MQTIHKSEQERPESKAVASANNLTSVLRVRSSLIDYPLYNDFIGYMTDHNEFLAKFIENTASHRYKITDLLGKDPEHPSPMLKLVNQAQKRLDAAAKITEPDKIEKDERLKIMSDALLLIAHRRYLVKELLLNGSEVYTMLTDFSDEGVLPWTHYQAVLKNAAALMILEKTAESIKTSVSLSKIEDELNEHTQYLIGDIKVVIKKTNTNKNGFAVFDSPHEAANNYLERIATLLGMTYRMLIIDTTVRDLNEVSALLSHNISNNPSSYDSLTEVCNLLKRLSHYIQLTSKEKALLILIDGNMLDGTIEASPGIAGYLPENFIDPAIASISARIQRIQYSKNK